MNVRTNNVLRWATYLLMMTACVFQRAASQLAAGKSKFLGNIYRTNGYTNTQFTKYWNQVTPENAGKWSFVEGVQNGYNWTTLDAAYNFAQQNGFPYKHHTLIWGNQQPAWIGTLDTASQRAEIEEWIQLAGARYPDADFVDVVNEPLHAPPVYKNALGGDGATQWDWVIKSFELARQYWPNAQLHLNDYSIINSSSATADYLVIINLLKDRGLIDGIGVQGHSFEVINATPTTLKTNLDALAATGLPIYISEFDINILNDDVVQGTTQLQKYQEIFPVLYEHPGVHGITLWGYVIDEIWLTNAFLLGDRLAKRPAMLWLENYFVAPKIPSGLTPDAIIGVPRNPVLSWLASETATSYRVQINTNSLFPVSAMVLDTTVTDTLLQVGPFPANTNHYWRVSASNSEGTSSFSVLASFRTGEQIVSVETVTDIPAEFSLSQNFPNPFNPATTIRFSLPTRSSVRLVLFTALGQEVQELASGDYNAGQHQVTVNIPGLASGVYFYRLETNTGFIQTKQLTVLK